MMVMTAKVNLKKVLLALAAVAALCLALIALLGGSAAIAGGVRYLLVVLFAGCVWPLTFWWFGRLGRR